MYYDYGVTHDSKRPVYHQLMAGPCQMTCKNWVWDSPSPVSSTKQNTRVEYRKQLMHSNPVVGRTFMRHANATQLTSVNSPIYGKSTSLYFC